MSYVERRDTGIPGFFVPDELSELIDTGGGEGTISVARLFYCPRTEHYRMVIMFHKPEETTKRAAEVEREFRLRGLLDNENVIKMIGHPYKSPTSGPNMAYFLVTEHGGQTLADKITDGGKVLYSLQDARKYVAEMLRALSYLNYLGVTNVGLTTRNVAVNHLNQVKILGIGKEYVRADECGVEHFQPPEEQVKFKDEFVKEREKKGDIFRVAAIMYELLTGQSLFKGDTLRLQMQLLRGSASAIRQLRNKILPNSNFEVARKAPKLDLWNTLISSVMKGRGITTTHLQKVPLMEFFSKSLCLDPHDRATPFTLLSLELLHIEPEWRLEPDPNLSHQEQMVVYRDRILAQIPPS